MNRHREFQILEAASVLLFAFQAVRSLFSVLFGIIYDGIFVGPMGPWMIISNLLVVVAFLLPAFTARRLRARALGYLAMVAALSRLGLSINDPTMRYWGALLILAAAGPYLGGLLRFARSTVVPALFLALSLDQLLRGLGDTYDLGLRSWWLALQIPWALAILVSARLPRRLAGEARPAGLGLSGGLALGAFLFLVASLLGLPNGMARWSRVDYAVVAPLNLAVTLIFLSPRARERVVLWMRDASLSRVLPGGALVGGLMGGYFVPGLMGVLGLLLAQAAAYVLLLAVLEGDVDDRQRIGPALTLGLLFFLVANFLNAFAFTYPYTLPAMRGMGWAVYLAAALALSAGIAGREFKRPASGVQLALPLYGYAMLSLLALIFHVWPRSAFPLPESGPLRFATYNIHYGYDEPWHFNLEEQAATIAANEVDVIALQEVDTGRLTSYGVDDAYFLGRRLGMNVAYLPAVEHLTGIAVLHKGKARHVDWRLLTSLQEQTGIVGVELDLGARSIHSFGIWLGLSDEDTERQIAEALAFIGDRTPATFGGDFNAPDDSPVADAIRAAGFDDPFTLLGMAPPPPTSSALDPQKRIDYVWVRGLQPRDAWVDTSVASDHLMVVVEVERP